MSEKLKNALIIASKIILYLVFVVLTIIGVGKIGWFNLCLELIGLLGIIGMLWWYNLRNK